MGSVSQSYRSQPSIVHAGDRGARRSDFTPAGLTDQMAPACDRVASRARAYTIRIWWSAPRDLPNARSADREEHCRLSSSRFPIASLPASAATSSTRLRCVAWETSSPGTAPSNRASASYVRFPAPRPCSSARALADMAHHASLQPLRYLVGRGLHSGDRGLRVVLIYCYMPAVCWRSRRAENRSRKWWQQLEAARKSIPEGSFKVITPWRWRPANDPDPRKPRIRLRSFRHPAEFIDERWTNCAADPVFANRNPGGIISSL